jgi:hypothetical protein
MNSVWSINEIVNRLINHHAYWHTHDKETTPFNYTYLRKRDSLLISAIDRKMFGINGLPDALEMAGINPLCHLRGTLYGKNASLEDRKKRFLEVFSCLLLEVGDPKKLNDLTMNSRRTFVVPSSFQANMEYPVCENCGCKILPITFQSVYARGRGLFGNWNSVLKAAGFNYLHIRRKKPKYKREEVMRDLLQFMKKRGTQWNIMDIRKQNSALYKGIFNSHKQSPFYFANLMMSDTAFIELQYHYKKKSQPEITPEEFYMKYVEMRQKV